MSKDIEKFYDALLVKVLGLPKVQQEIAEFRKDEAWNKEYDWGEFNFAEQALENFVQGDDKDILAVPEIWAIVQEAVREEACWITYNAKTFLEEMSSLDGEKIYNKRIEDIHNGLYHALKRKHGKE